MNKKLIAITQFKRVYVEISNICNLDCTFCSPLTRSLQTMTPDEFRHIAVQIKPHTSFIYFHVKGEPLIHSQLELMLDIAHEHGLRVNLTTNGTLLKGRQEMLLSHPAVRQVNISLHALTEQDTYVDDAVRFAKLANERGIYTVLRLWNLSRNNQTDDKSRAIMRLIEDSFPVGKDSLTNRMDSRASVQLDKNTFIGWEQEFVWPSLANEFVSDSGYCYGMRHQIAILVDGTVVPCCLDANGSVPLGNVFSESFTDIIAKKRAKAIRHGFERGEAVEQLCKHCSFRTKFD